jgi:hypothetical protein
MYTFRTSALLTQTHTRQNSSFCILQVLELLQKTFAM